MSGILKVRNTAKRIDGTTLLLKTFVRDGRLAKKEDVGGFGAFLVTQDGSIISWFGLHVGTERFTTLTHVQFL